MNDSRLIYKNMGRNMGMSCSPNNTGSNSNYNNGMNDNKMSCNMKIDKNRCMQNIYELGFAMTETILFLDTHPDDRDAMNYYTQTKEQYQKYKEYYEQNYGPLDCYQVENQNYWSWVMTPMPWEMEG